MAGGAPPGGTTGTAPGGTTGTAPGDGSTGGTTQRGTGGTTARGGMGGLLNSATPNTEVVAALTADADQYTWVAAAVGSQNAAGLQLGTGLPVMAIGGFNGSDPSPTLEQFQQYVAEGKIHYFAPAEWAAATRTVAAGRPRRSPSWVAATYPSVTIGGSTFYDLTQPLSSGATSTGA